MTELLAPAGSFDALRAAIANGANAVYLGGKSFSARAFADNFTLEELSEAVALAHFHGVKVYVTANTLVGDKEIVALLFYVSELYKMGVDAVIIQDLGLIDLIRQAVPGLALHASTQMTACSAPALRLLAAHGAERVILARELSFEDLRTLGQDSPLPLETFVHGALCVCYSGQCLFSSMVGGRSGNRGRCAQPCRMAYRLVNEFGEEAESPVEGKYLLSPKDLFGYERAEDLHELGLAAWKIEGRMKKPQYVATVCRIYSQLLRDLDAGRVVYPSQEDLRQLMQVFNRDKCQGYWLGNPGAALMSYSRPNNRGLFLGRISEAANGRISLRLATRLNRGDGIEIWQTGKREGCTVDTIWIDGQARDTAEAGQLAVLAANGGRAGDRVFKTYDAPLMEQAELSYHALADKPLSFHINAHVGAPITVSVADEDGYFSTRTSEYVVEQAHNRAPSTMNIAYAQLGRLGGSGYYLASLKGEIDDEALLPASVLNQLRRDLVEDIMVRRRAVDRNRAFDAVAFSRVVRELEPAGEEDGSVRPLRDKSLRVTLLLQCQTVLEEAVKRGFREAYLDCCGFKGQAEPDWRRLGHLQRERRLQVSPFLPQILLPHQEAALARQVQLWQENNIDSLVVNNIGQIRLLEELGWSGRLYGGWALNVFNSPACRFLKGHGLSRITLSPELTLSQLEQLDAAGLETEVFAQGALQLMISEYCLLGAACGRRNVEGERNTPCSQPCQHSEPLFLLDEKGYRFPLRQDAACRMHIFNSREHCLLEEIPQLRQAGMDRILLDLRLYDDRRALQILDLYKDVTTDSFVYEEAKRRLPQVMKEYTKGHLFRGV